MQLIISSCENKAWKKKDSGLYGIQTNDLCDTGAALWLLLELHGRSHLRVIIVWICSIPVEDEDERVNVRNHIFELRNKDTVQILRRSSQLCMQWKINPENNSGFYG